MVTIIQYSNGMLEDASDDLADGLLRAGLVQIVGRRPETTMLQPEENAMLPAAAPVIVSARRTRNKKKKKGC